VEAEEALRHHLRWWKIGSKDAKEQNFRVRRNMFKVELNTI
jgi:hypothetical protein